MSIYDENLQRVHKDIVNASYGLSACAQDRSATQIERDEAERLLGACDVLKLAVCISLNRYDADADEQAQREAEVVREVEQEDH